MTSCRCLLAFLLSCLQAQELAANAAPNYETYHIAINNAEQQLVLGHTDSALAWYRQAFRKYNFIFVKDAANAAQIALHNGRPAQANSFLLKGAASGLRYECLEGIPMLRDYVAKQENGMLRQRMTESCVKFVAGRNKALIAEWNGRYQDEQGAKNDPIDNHESFLQYRDIVRQNVAAIDTLWKSRHLFPADQVLGPGKCTEMGNMTAFYSLAHYDCSASTFQYILWAAVEAGMLHPREYAALWEFERLREETVKASQQTNGGCKAVLKKFGVFWYHDTDAVSRAEMAANRSRYWLCPLFVDSALKELKAKEGYVMRFGYL